MKFWDVVGQLGTEDKGYQVFQFFSDGVSSRSNISNRHKKRKDNSFAVAKSLNLNIILKN